MEHKEAGSGLQGLKVPGQDAQNPLKGQPGLADVSFCASPSDRTITPPRKRKASPGDARDSLGGLLRQALMQHQFGITVNLLFLLTLTYVCFPDLRSRLEPFFQLQYALPSGMFYQGRDDVWFILGFVVLFTGVRAACLDCLLLPMARTFGIKKRKMQVRFAEQAYLLMYYIVLWSWGVYLFVQDTPVSESTTKLGQINDLLLSIWRDFPRLAMSGSMKAYYLCQSAFWVQQIIVIHLEERRKDHWQMLAHHFITVGLLAFSYSYRQMRAGNAILILMDVVDLIFPLAKCLRYLGLTTACDIAFGVFVITWVLARHVAYMAIMYSIVFHIGSKTMLYGTYSTDTGARLSSDGGSQILSNLLQPFLQPDSPTVQNNASTVNVFTGLLGGLQVITCVWFAMICKVVVRVLRGEGADDTRSDDEGEEDDDSDKQFTRPTLSQRGSYIEITAEAEDLYLPTLSRTSSTSRVGMTRKKSKGISSGLSLGDHKDILNRIGCLSDEQLAREAERRQESSSPAPGNPTAKRA